MSKSIKPAKAQRFVTGGRIGRHPGDGPRNMAGTAPPEERPRKGYALRPKGSNRKPPKGFKP